MENVYNDFLMPEDFQQIAKAYSKSLKDKGFVFVSLQQEEINLLLGEVFVILAKMQACLLAISSMDAKILNQKLCDSRKLLEEKFGKKKMHNFKCILTEEQAFLALVSLQNLLTIKLMLLSVKSGELETCNSIITAISSVFAESFSTEGFALG